MSLQEQGKLPEAMVHYQEAVRLKPDFAEAHFRLGNASREQGHLAAALEQYQDSLPRSLSCRSRITTWALSSSAR